MFGYGSTVGCPCFEENGGVFPALPDYSGLDYRYRRILPYVRTRVHVSDMLVMKINSSLSRIVVFNPIYYTISCLHVIFKNI